MRFILALSLCLFGSFSAIADSSFYELVGDMYARGSKPVVNQVTDVAWAGRCFMRDQDQNAPKNAGYILRKTHTDAGPIGSNRAIYESASYWQTSEAANFFDNKSLQWVLSNVNISFTVVSTTGDAIVTDYKNGEISQLRSFEKFLVEEIVSVSNGSARVRCYYFIPGL